MFVFILLVLTIGCARSVNVDTKPPEITFKIEFERQENECTIADEFYKEGLK